MRNLVIVRKTIILFSIINIVVIVYSVIMRIQNVNQKSELGLFFWYKIIFCLLLCGYMIFEAVMQKKLYETAPFGMPLDKAEAKGNQYRHKE